MRPLKDPAPSRFSYRVNRLMLTPGFRRFLRLGLPVLILLSAGMFWASDVDRRLEAADRLAEIKRQIQERPEFMVRMMAVESSSDDVASEIRSVVPIDFPISSFDLDLSEIQKTIETLDVVAEASVHIRRGGVLSVDIIEREPVVIWRNENDLVLLDRTGHPVKQISQRSERPELILIAGPGADEAVPEALRLQATAGPAAERLRGLVRIGERRWDVVLDRNQKIQLPEDEPDTAWAKVVALDQAQDLLARDIAVIDFRNPRRPVLRLTEGAISAMLEANWPKAQDQTE